MAKANSIEPILTDESIALFWSKIDIRGPDDCWLWKAGRTSHSYGRINIGTRKNKRQFYAHVLARYLATGVWPNGLFTCHDCPGGDNPQCVNSAHLWLGTQSQNMKDCKNKVRHGIGCRNGQALLTDDQVREIRCLCASGKHTHFRIGLLFGVGREAIDKIARGERWQHVA